MKISEFKDYTKNLDVIIAYINKERGYEICNFQKVVKGYIIFTTIDGGKYMDKAKNIKRYDPVFFQKSDVEKIACS
jgi:hypothetical protein